MQTILYFDIENSPMLGHAWGTYQTDLLSVEKDTELLSFAYKINDKPTKVMSRRLYSEKQLVQHLWKLFDEADIIVGHNGDSFDIKMSNMYFLKYDLKPPSPYKSIDTKKIAKRYFRFAQNKLDYLSSFLFQDKKKSTNLELWFRCMEGDESALVQMERYNKHDVDLLYKLYHKLKGWTTNHPNYNMYHGTTHKCPVCGGETQRRGYAITRTQKYQRYQCKSCGAWSNGERVPLQPKTIK